MLANEKNKMDARGSDDGSEFPKLQDCKKNEPPGRNLEITLKMNKWALLKETACNKMKSTTYPYHVVLIPKTKTKRQRTWDKLPRWIKKCRVPHGDTKYLLGKVV
jgi:hypothetical protein